MFGQAAVQVGMAPAWDVRTMMATLIDHSQRYSNLLGNMNISEWVAKGAPDSYARQKDVVQREVGFLGSVARRLSTEPEKLSLALDALFRLQTLEALTSSLAEGSGRYENEKVGEELRSILDQNAATRQRLRQYVLDLSVTKETEYAVAEKEAQRCQSVLNRNPLAPVPVENRRPKIQPPPPQNKQQEK